MIRARTLVEAVLGVWQGEIAGAFLFGLAVVLGDLILARWRARITLRLPPAGFGWFLGLTFLVRLVYFVAGFGLAMNLFGRQGQFVVCLTFVLSIPAWILAASRAGKPKEG